MSVLILLEVQYVEMLVEGCQIEMEVDSGACISVISLELYNKNFHHLILEKKLNKSFVCVAGQVKDEGTISVKVQKFGDNEVHQLDLLVVNTSQSIPLMGRTWMDIFFPNWMGNFNAVPVKIKKYLLSMKVRKSLVTQLMSKFPRVFERSSLQSQATS